MIKKVFIFMCALLLQGSGFCVLSEALPAVVSVALSSTDAGFKYSYCRVSALTQPVDQTILVRRTDYAFLIKQFQAPQSAGVVNASKLRFIRQFVMAVKKRQSTQILLRCPFDEKMSFIVQLRFGLKVPGAKKASTDVTIYGLWPTIPQQIFEFVKTSVEQKTVWSITQKVVAVGAACGGALGVGAVVNNVRDARLQREKKAAQDLEDEKERHKTNCRSGYCQRYYGILCDGHGETDPVVAAQNKKARETAKNEQNHRDRCQNNLCYRFGELTCDGWGELNRELWAQKAQEREAAAAQERENDRIRRIANEANHRDFCRNRYCGRYGNFECDGYGETNRDFWAERAEQRRLAEVERIERERVAAIDRDRERAAAEVRRRVEAEMAQRVPRLAQALQRQFARNENVFLTHTKLVADDKISCFVYDLSHFNLDLLQEDDIRVLVIGVSDLSKAGPNPVAGRREKTVAQVLRESAKDFKDRGWKIIIVNCVLEAAFNVDLVAQINQTFSLCGPAVVSLDVPAEPEALADLVGRIRDFVFDSPVRLDPSVSVEDSDDKLECPYCNRVNSFVVSGSCKCLVKAGSCRECFDVMKERSNTCPLCASADFSIVQIRKEPAGV